ncbi:MAG: poly(R)-hydroxyalkanoic acid synthase subunit PhaE [Syntrophales bacterium]
MKDKKKTETEENTQGVIFADWVKNQVDVWEAAMQQTAKDWQKPFAASQTHADAAPPPPGPDVVFKEIFEFFQFLSSITGMPKPDAFESTRSVGDLILKIFQPFWGFSIRSEQQIAEMLGMTTSGSSENIVEFLKQTTKMIHQTHVDDFRKILNIPQIGLTRYYQERINKVVENASDFQSAIGEFFQMLMIPMEKSYYAVKEEITRLEREGNTAIDGSRALYQLWIQKLEDHYLALLRSNDYIETLRETLNKMHDFQVARAEFFMDLLQHLPIPTNRDMDEVYKDLHILKKRVKELERKEVQREAEKDVSVSPNMAANFELEIEEQPISEEKTRREEEKKARLKARAEARRKAQERRQRQTKGINAGESQRKTDAK